MDCIWWTKVNLFHFISFLNNVSSIASHATENIVRYLIAAHQIDVPILVLWDFHLVGRWVGRSVGWSVVVVMQFFAISFLSSKWLVVFRLVSNIILFRSFKKMRLLLICVMHLTLICNCYIWTTIWTEMMQYLIPSWIVCFVALSIRK